VSSESHKAYDRQAVNNVATVRLALCDTRPICLLKGGSRSSSSWTSLVHSVKAWSSGVSKHEPQTGQHIWGGGGGFMFSFSLPVKFWNGTSGWATTASRHNHLSSILIGRWIMRRYLRKWTRH